MKRLLLLIIRWYQQTLSLDSGIMKMVFPNAGVCRFTPTCSQYAYGAIERYGIMTGLFLAFKRIIRCHPGTPGGYDPVPTNL